MADTPNIMPSFNMSGLSTASPYIIAVVVALIVAAPVIWLIWKKKTYKHIGVIVENRNGQIVEFKVPYRYKVINNTECIKFWGTPKFEEKPSQEYLRRIGNRDVIYYQRGNDGYLYPSRTEVIDENPGTIRLRVGKRDADFWASMRSRMAIQKWDKKNFLEMYAMPIGMIMMAMVFIIGNWIVYNGVKDAVAPIGSAASALRESNAMMNESLYLTRVKMGLETPVATPQPVPGRITVTGGG